MDLIGGGKVGGVPWLAWMHDNVQDNPIAGAAPEEGGLGFSFIGQDNRMFNYIGAGDGELTPWVNSTMTHALSQSVPEPASVVLMVVGGWLLLRRRRYLHAA